MFLDGLGRTRCPTRGPQRDFFRCFEQSSTGGLQEAIHRSRLAGGWADQPASFFAETAKIDADASLVGADGQPGDHAHPAVGGALVRFEYS